MGTELITQSRIRDFNACKRLHHIRYNVRRRPRRTPAQLAFGTVTHHGLEGWWNAVLGGLPADERLRIAIEFATDAFADMVENGAALEDDDLVRIKALLVGYEARWGAFTDEWEVIGVEVRFVAPLVNPATRRASVGYQLGGKLDVLARRRSDGSIWIIEHKTSGQDISPGSTYWQRLRMDPQISTYMAGADTLGAQPAGVLYDVLVKPKAKPLKATPDDARKFTQGKACKCSKPTGAPHPDCGVCSGSGWIEAPRLYAGQRAEDETLDEYAVRIAADIASRPGEYFARAEIIRLDAEVVEHAQDTWQTTRAIHEAKRSGAHPRNPNECFAHGKEPCPYFGPCSGAGDLSDDVVYRDADQNEELIQIEQPGEVV